MEYILPKIKSGWDMDFHVHTRWSLDIPNGPQAQEYLSLAEENKIHICFLDHYELWYLDHLDCPFKEKQWQPEWPFSDGKWEIYLEEMDEIRSNYSFISSGLEIDYYPDMEDEIKNFIDDYGKDFDLLAGSLHEIEHWRPVTIPEDLKFLVKKYNGFENVITKYYDLQEKMVKSKIFKAITHPDTIFRYCKGFIPFDEKYDNHSRTQDIIDLCIETDTWFEINLSGYRYPINRPFPPNDMVSEALKNGAKIFVGSDSHAINTFEQFIPKIKHANNFVKDNWKIN